MLFVIRAVAGAVGIDVRLSPWLVLCSGLLALFLTVTQVQGTMVRNAGEVVQRPLTDLGNLGYVLLIVSGVAVAARRRWPVPVFLTTALTFVNFGVDEVREDNATFANLVALGSLDPARTT